MKRRELLLRAAALLAFPAARLLAPASAHAGKIASWPHSLTNLMQNGVGSTQGPVHMHWDLPHDDFTVDFCYVVSQGKKKGALAWFIYREKDAKNFYQLELRATELALVRRIAGTFSDMQKTPHLIDPAHELMVRVTVVGDHHQVWLLNPDKTVGALVLDHHDSTYLSGINHSYYTASGVNGCWEEAIGRPL